MKRDTVIEKLNGVQDGDYSSFLDWLMSENGSDVNRAKGNLNSLKDELDAANAKVEELLKAKDEAEKAGLTKEQLLERQIAEYETKKAELDKMRNRVNAKVRMTESGLTSEEADKLLDRFVVADAAATDAILDALLEVFASQRESAIAATKQELINGTPKPDAKVASSQGITKEQFDKMDYFQKAELFDSDPETYKQLTQGE